MNRPGKHSDLDPKEMAASPSFSHILIRLFPLFPTFPHFPDRFLCILNTHI